MHENQNWQEIGLFIWSKEGHLWPAVHTVSEIRTGDLQWVWLLQTKAFWKMTHCLIKANKGIFAGDLGLAFMFNKDWVIEGAQLLILFFFIKEILLQRDLSWRNTFDWLPWLQTLIIFFVVQHQRAACFFWSSYWSCDIKLTDSLWYLPVPSDEATSLEKPVKTVQKRQKTITEMLETGDGKKAICLPQ